MILVELTGIKISPCTAAGKTRVYSRFLVSSSASDKACVDNSQSAADFQPHSAHYIRHELEGLPATVSLRENSPAGTEVYCFEIDLSTGASIASGFPLILNSNPLTRDFMVSMVNSTHAKVTVTGSPSLDFESPLNHYVLQLLVVDSSEGFDLQTMTVILTDVDEPPVFLDENSFLYIVEKSPPGQIYQPIVFDPENKPLTVYTGLVSIASRMDRDSAPLRNNPTITVTVMASFSPPGPPLSNSINITVTVNDINDNPPICFADNQRREVPETEVKGAVMATITCTDNDVVPSFTQFIFTGNAFVYVTVTPVNEFAPVFNPVTYSYTISELLGSGAVIGSVNATDRDLPPTPLLYSIVSGGGTGGLKNIFHLDPKLGKVSLLTRPDYEDTKTHTLTIRVVDGDRIRPRSATATVIINITDANDEPPLCGPNKTNLVIPVDLRIGATVQSFSLSCTDRDSPPSSFIYTISASNVNNHFGFTPRAGSNVSRLILREPFDYSSGMDTQWSYTLTALISDANLGSAPAQTGTVIINVRVVDPDLTTVITTTTPRITYINVEKNSFNTDDWYVWFVIALGGFLLLAMLAYLLHRCWTYLSTKKCYCCETPHKEELAVFDGEGVDPVTKRVYEYNSKSGARRWKDAIIVSEPALIQPESSTLVISGKAANAESSPRSIQSGCSTQTSSVQSQTSMQGLCGSGQM
ncbi:cadherin-related family member 3-like [Salminus brasiliensis]|uniref:cadherin-related family member 3-like n=1 Tax=Salminus brasiliensis TaxID=930266 RepID=UPI003B83384F